MFEPAGPVAQQGPPEPPRRPRALGRIFGTVFIAAGALMLLPFAWSAWGDYRVQTQYRETTCSIVGKRIRMSTSDSSSSSSGKTTYYRPEFTLRYDVEGRQYLADGYDSSGTSDGGVTRTQEALARFALWKEYPCWYDPRGPAKVVLTRVLSTAYVAALVPTLAIAVGFFVRRASGSAPGGPPPPSPDPRHRDQFRAAPAGRPRRWNPLGRIGTIVAVGFPVALAVVVGMFVFVLAPAYRIKPPTDVERHRTFEDLGSGQTGKVRASVEGGVSSDALDDEAVPLLVRALERCGPDTKGDEFAELAVFLVKKGANVNARAAAAGMTPLATAVASRACPAAVVRTLVGAGARE
jgi:hypothetical protein